VHLQAATPGQRGDVRQAFLEQGQGGDRLQLEAEVAGLQAREVDGVGDQLGQVMGIPGDLGQALALPGGQRPVGVHEHQIHVPDDVVERRVQLVADRRQEFLFDAIGGLIGLLGGEGGTAAGGDVPEEERLPGGPVIAVWMWQAAEFDPALALGSVDGSLALAGGSR